VKLDTKLKRFVLKPLATRKHRTARQKAYMEALSRLDERALGNSLVQQLRDTISPPRTGTEKADWKNPERAKKFVALAKALYAARRISTAEYVIYACNPVESIHDDRWFNGSYNAELSPIDKELGRIREEYGLKGDEAWYRGDEPNEYSQLETVYETILNEKFVEILEEFGLTDLAQLKREDPERFDELRERGRRTVFHKDEFVAAIRDVVIRYEIEARQAASTGAYSAAIACLGAGIEGLLLLRCLRSKKKATQISQTLPRRIRPRSASDLSSWTFETLIEVCLAAGWLPAVETTVARYNSAALAHTLRVMRNYLHPGKRARERPWSEADEREYQDANSIYLVLLSTLGKDFRRKGKPDTSPPDWANAS
jgi:hypothetical protein